MIGAQSNNLIQTLRIGLPAGVPEASVMPDDHSEVVPLLPIPNRTVKRLSADDSAGSRVKVGHRQAIISKGLRLATEAFLFGEADKIFMASRSEAICWPGSND